MIVTFVPFGEEVCVKTNMQPGYNGIHFQPVRTVYIDTEHMLMPWNRKAQHLSLAS